MYENLKRKLRELKKLEVKIRFKNQNVQTALVFNEFFDANTADSKKVMYSLEKLDKMSKEQYKEVISDFFFCMYLQFYKENGILPPSVFDPGILRQMDLGPEADRDAVKKRFRQLAKTYHPDVGGDSEKFIELMEMYNNLM